eukprot:m.248462 g.248462  ORF g.248462 m.248462 type:complete len:481 (-) comp17164_c1_seq17:165-1607(-)
MEQSMADTMTMSNGSKNNSSLMMMTTLTPRTSDVGVDFLSGSPPLCPVESAAVPSSFLVDNTMPFTPFPTQPGFMLSPFLQPTVSPFPQHMLLPSPLPQHIHGLQSSPWLQHDIQAFATPCSQPMQAFLPTPEQPCLHPSLNTESCDGFVVDDDSLSVASRATLHPNRMHVNESQSENEIIDNLFPENSDMNSMLMMVDCDVTATPVTTARNTTSDHAQQGHAWRSSCASPLLLSPGPLTEFHAGMWPASSVGLVEQQFASSHDGVASFASMTTSQPAVPLARLERPVMVANEATPRDLPSHQAPSKRKPKKQQKSQKQQRPQKQQKQQKQQKRSCKTQTQQQHVASIKEEAVAEDVDLSIVEAERKVFSHYLRTRGLSKQTIEALRRARRRWQDRTAKMQKRSKTGVLQQELQELKQQAKRLDSNLQQQELEKRSLVTKLTEQVKLALRKGQSIPDHIIVLLQQAGLGEQDLYTLSIDV